VPPDRAVELVVEPRVVGRHAVLCDNFCGDGHDRMVGWLEVSA
jgi:heme/copper-type cytochrome/quinol oxidase subunit 2